MQTAIVIFNCCIKRPRVTEDIKNVPPCASRYLRPFLWKIILQQCCPPLCMRCNKALAKVGPIEGSVFLLNIDSSKGFEESIIIRISFQFGKYFNDRHLLMYNSDYRHSTNRSVVTSTSFSKTTYVKKDLDYEEAFRFSILGSS